MGTAQWYKSVAADYRRLAAEYQRRADELAEVVGNKVVPILRAQGCGSLGGPFYRCVTLWVYARPLADRVATDADPAREGCVRKPLSAEHVDSLTVELT